jgi:hypothetical protein
MPCTPGELALCKLFATVLGLPIGSVRPVDEFFALGGDSFLALRLVVALRGTCEALRPETCVVDREFGDPLGVFSMASLRSHDSPRALTAALARAGFDIDQALRDGIALDATGSGGAAATSDKTAPPAVTAGPEAPDAAAPPPPPPPPVNHMAVRSLSRLDRPPPAEDARPAVRFVRGPAILWAASVGYMPLLEVAHSLAVPGPVWAPRRSPMATPLHAACSAAQVDCVAFLLDVIGISVLVVDAASRSALHAAARCRPQDPRTLESGFTATLSTRGGATGTTDPDLLDPNSDPDPDPRGTDTFPNLEGARRTELERRVAATIELLHARGHPLTVQDRNKMNVLHSAASSPIGAAAIATVRRLEPVVFAKLLNAHDRWVRCPIHWAVVGDNTATVAALLAMGANPAPDLRHVSKHASTRLPYESPLEISRRRGNPEIERLLLEALGHERSSGPI